MYPVYLILKQSNCETWSVTWQNSTLRENCISVRNFQNVTVVFVFFPGSAKQTFHY